MSQLGNNHQSFPEWIQKAVIYHIFPMGFFDCPAINPIALKNHQLAQIQPAFRLHKLRSYYAHLRRLHINTICFGPIFEACTHGYDTINYFQIDRRLGTNNLFQEIVNELHAQGFRVIIDGVFNHTSRLFPAFLHLKQYQKKSPFIEWYKKIDFQQDTVWHDGFSYQNWENHTELPELNLQNPDVQKYILNIIQYWTDKYHLDGWRLDVAYQFDLDFIGKIKTTLRQINPSGFLLGELIHQDYSAYLGHDLLDSCTNYQLYSTIIDSFNQHDPWQLQSETKRQHQLYPHNYLLNFTGNHDTTRLYTALQNKTDIYNFYNFIINHHGLPCIYYGDEIGLDGEKLSDNDHMVRQPMPYPNHFSSRQQAILSKIIDIFDQHYS